jgi:hypothetical protein
MLRRTFPPNLPLLARALSCLGVAVALAASSSICVAQNTPLISGGVGFFSQTTGGQTLLYPTIEPVLVDPIGNQLLIESRASLFEFFSEKGAGRSGYNMSHFIGLTYLQADIVASRHLTVVLGDYLIPFNTYNDRLSPIWISNFQDGPLIANLSFTSSGSGLGEMVSGNAMERKNYSIDYNVYYSVRSSNEQFSASHGIGGRSSLHLPRQRLELGLSYNRLMQDTHENFYGAHAWWEPEGTAFRFRSEYGRGHHADGYWVEADYRTQAFGGLNSAVGRIEPVLRFQQTFRRDNVVSDGLPAVNTQQMDFGLDYNLPHNTRILTSYARQFSATKDVNVWETGIVYRFLFPAWKGKQP